MNRIHRFFWLFAVPFILLFKGCSEPENELTAGSKHTLTSQAEVAAFRGGDQVHSVIIRGENITDLSVLNLQKVTELIIEDTGIEFLDIPRLNAVTAALTIRDNKHLKAIRDLGNLYFMNGTLTITRNPQLTDISGLLGLKLFKGTLAVTDNVTLGENEPCASNDIGFCVIKYLMQSGIIDGQVLLSGNAPGSGSDPARMGQMPGSDIISYVIASASDVENFSPLSDTVMNLRITGSAITDQLLKTIASRISWAKGTVTIENTGITNTEGFFDQVTCEGSIVLRNNLQLTNPNGFKAYTAIQGDLIIENCPNLFFWASPDGNAGFSAIARIEGSLRINPATSMDSGGGGLGKLTYVGGDLEITGDRTKGEIWNLDTWYAWSGGIRHIGGDLIFKNHYKVNGLSGFQALEHIGGNVYILDNGGPDGVIPIASTPYQVGFCLIKGLLDKGVI